MTRRVLFIWLLGLGLVAALAAQAPRSFMYRVQTKSWTQVPEEYRTPFQATDVCVGMTYKAGDKTSRQLNLARVGRTSWRYQLKDNQGHAAVLYAPSNWRLSPGDFVVISGAPNEAGVFIPQGARYHGR